MTVAMIVLWIVAFLALAGTIFDGIAALAQDVEGFQGNDVCVQSWVQIDLRFLGLFGVSGPSVGVKGAWAMIP